MNSYEVTDMNDKRLGEVEGQNYIEAAFKAARVFFKKPNARRETEWPGHDGIFSAFNLSEEVTTEFRLKVIK